MWHWNDGICYGSTEGFIILAISHLPVSTLIVKRTDNIVFSMFKNQNWILITDSIDLSYFDSVFIIVNRVSQQWSVQTLKWFIAFWFQKDYLSHLDKRLKHTEITFDESLFTRQKKR